MIFKTLLFITTLMLLMKSTSGSWVLEVEIQNITILYEVAYDEDEMYCCCDGCKDSNECCFPDPMSSNCTGYGTCDSIITVCLLINGAAPQQCVRSNDIFNSESLFTFFSSLSASEMIYNRLYFFGDHLPSDGSIGLNITIDERDGGTDNPRLTPMDTFLLQWNFTTSSVIGSPQVYTSSEGVAQLSIASRFYCADNYFGSDCETYCDSENYVPCSQTTVCLESISFGKNTIHDIAQAAEPQSDDSSCEEWRISTLALIVILGLCFGICCTSTCLLVALRKHKTQRSREPSNFANPMYGGEQSRNPEEKQQLEDYVAMSAATDVSNHDSGTIKEQCLGNPPNVKDLGQYYEVMPNQSTRTDFSKLATPDNKGFTHTYEAMSFEDEKQDSNKTEQYNQLKH